MGGLCEMEKADLSGPCGRLDVEQGQGRLVGRGNQDVPVLRRRLHLPPVG